MLLSFAQLRAIAAGAGFPDPDLMAAVAMAESGGDTSAVNDTRGLTDAQIRAKFRLAPGTPVKQEWSIGLWQINALTGDVDPVRLKDPNYNAQVAYARSSGGTDLNPWWLTVSRGAYKKFLPAGYAAPLPEFSGVVAPARSSGSAALAAVGALALAAAAGLAVRAGQSRREPEPPLPWP